MIVFAGFNHCALRDAVVFEYAIYRQNFSNYFFIASFNIVIVWSLQQLVGDKSTLVQVMVWCSQATSHYLNEWSTHRSMTSFYIIWPQWVSSTLNAEQDGWHFADNIFFQISPKKMLPRVWLTMKTAMVQVMAWWLIGNKPLPDPMLTKMSEAMLHH